MTPEQMELIDGLPDEGLVMIINDMTFAPKPDLSASFFALLIHPLMQQENITAVKILDYCVKAGVARGVQGL